ncbi:DMT family transporter [Bacillus solimangrovi]|uniref:Transporter family-2 protein n=1 Tax=Bacillus solimangrovi TaxID=1305675 RepID=A0A1E5LHR5_9BACI|nr:DMT family transporter [Bacillus solimangrovi]OEH93623.1 hypothetical protein BFG57_01155 [Bacillus solimangrovi]
MKGVIFAFLAGAFITIQGVANSRISVDMGTWQTATITHLTGFIAAFLIMLVVRDIKWKMFKKVNPLYLSGGSFGAFVVFGNIMAMNRIGATFTIAGLLISQLAVTFLVDSKGWFGVKKQKIELPQFIGFGMMLVGVIILSV